MTLRDELLKAAAHHRQMADRYTGLLRTQHLSRASLLHRAATALGQEADSFSSDPDAPLGEDWTVVKGSFKG